MLRVLVIVMLEEMSFFCVVCLTLIFQQEIPMDNREDAVISMVYEATARLRDPVYGSVGIISALRDTYFTCNPS